MSAAWMITVAAVLGQLPLAADQPATQPADATSTAQVAPAQPEAQPVDTDAAIARLRQELEASSESPVNVATIGELSGNPVDIEVTSDGTMVLYGDEKDLAVLGAFIEMMDSAPLYQPTFRLFQLKSGDAADLARKIEQFWTAAKRPTTGQLRSEDRISVIPEARANMLMVAATEANMETIAQIIEQLDKPALGGEVQFQPIPLKHIKAAEAEQTLKNMIKSLQERRSVSRDLFTIQADVRTNMLLVSAPQADMEVIRHMIELIDVEVTAESGAVVKMAIYPLQRAVAKDLADALTKMLQTDADAAKAMKEQIRRLQVLVKSPDGSEKPLSDLDLDKPIKLFPEPGTNSIIVATVEKNLGPMGEIIHLLDSVPLADEMLVRIFPLEHADVDMLLTSLKDIFDQGKRLPEQPGRTVSGRIPTGLTGEALAYNVGLSGDKRTNTLIVSGRAEQLLLVQQIVKTVDVPQTAGGYSPRLVKLEHADVKAISDVVQKIAEQQQKIAEKVLSPAAAERQRTLIIPDVRTNSLIVVAREENFKEIEALAGQLDGVEDNWLGQIRIVNLHNLTAADLADKVRDLWERRAEQRREGGLPEDKPVIVTDTRSNSLIIASNQEDFEAIDALVKRLEDQRLAPMADIRLITIENNDVAKVSEIVRSLWDERLKMSLAKGQEEQPSDRIAIAEDPLTRTMLVASSRSSFEEIQNLVAKLDVPPVVDGVFRTFVVRHNDISKAADLLREVFDKGLYIGTTDTRNLPEAATKVTIVPDLRSSSLIVSASPQNLAIVESLLAQIDREDVPDLPAGARFFQIQHADVVNLADMLERMFEGLRASMTSDQRDQLEAQVIADPRTRSLIVTGARFALKRAEELVPRLDVASGGAAYAFRTYPLKEASASRLEPVVTELFEKRATQEQTGKRTPIHIIPDDGSNSLIVTASEEDHETVKHLITLLDRRSPIAEQMEVVSLREARAKTVADAINRMIEQQQGQRKGGFAIEAEERTNALLVWAAPDLMVNIRSIVEKLDNSKPKSEMGLRVFRLNNAKAEDLSDLLTQFFENAAGGRSADQARQMIIRFPALDSASGREVMRSLVHQDVTIAPDKNTNALMVLAPEEHIDMMQMLIEMLDRIEPVTSTIQVFPLRNADATEMKRLLDELFKPSGSDQERRQLVFAGGEGGGIPSGSDGSVVEVAFSVDERTNSLIAAGSTSYLKIVERLVLQLDYQEIEERVVRVVQVRNRPADQIAETMRAYFEEESQALEKASEGEAKMRQLQRQVTIQDAGEGSNTILLSYNPRMEANVVDMINELDRAPAQVMIQVLMAEVTLNDQFEMGMEFALQDLLFSEKATMGANDTLQGSNFDFIGGTDIGATGESPLGGISFTIAGEDFNFLFRALQTQGRVEVLSRPQIFVQDNQEANITVGERVPTVQDITVSSAGVVTPSVTYEDVGVILTVTPIVNADGYVSMAIKPEISSIGTSSVSVASGVNLPIFTQRSAETTVTVKDGETIVIGGLITSRDNDSDNKVPLAGDVPILGNLFRSTVRKSTKTELLIVLTPHVVRTPEDARTLSIQVRDQTGLLDNVRTNPLMERLQVKPDDDQFGPADMLRPTGEQKRRPDEGERLGPEVDEYGPPTSSILGETGDPLATRSR